MELESYKVSVPASIMLMGEHAVLRGHQAIVCAVDKRMNITLTPNNTREIIIGDSKLGSISYKLDDFAIEKPFEYVLAIIGRYKNSIKQGFTIDIDAEFASTIGLGSSAAVTIGTIAVMDRWLNSVSMSYEDIFNMAKSVLMDIQKLGSGADLAASLYGGVLAYSKTECKKLEFNGTFTAIYSGYKTPTKVVIEKINQYATDNPAKYNEVFAVMHNIVIDAIEAINTKDLIKLGKLFTAHHTQQVHLGTSDEVLEQLVEHLQAESNILGAKISGSGLGDCVIGLGTSSNAPNFENSKIQQFNLNVATEGLVYVS